MTATMSTDRRLPALGILAVSSAFERRIAALAFLAELERRTAREGNDRLEDWLARLLEGLGAEDQESRPSPRISGSVPASIITKERRVMLGLIIGEVLSECRGDSGEEYCSIRFAMANERGSLRVAVVCDSPAGEFSVSRGLSSSGTGKACCGLAPMLVRKLGGHFSSASLGAGFCAVIAIPLGGEADGQADQRADS